MRTHMYSNPGTQVLDMDFSTVASLAQAKHSVIIPVNTTIGCYLHLFNHSNHAVREFRFRNPGDFSWWNPES